MKNYKTRNDVPEKYKWDLTEYFTDEKDFNENYEKALKLVSKLKEYSGATKDANRLYEFIKLDEEASSIIENLYAYTYLVNDQELGIPSSMQNKNKIENLIAEYEANIAFFSPELLKLNNDEYNKLFEKPELLDYKLMLDKIYRAKEHILHEENEEIISRLTLSMNHFDDISSNMLNACHNYGTVKVNDETITLTPTNYRKIMKNSDEFFRKNTYEQFSKVLKQYSIISASLLDSYVKMNSTNAKIHNFKSSWDNKLFYSNMSNEVYKTLVKNVEANAASYQRYLNLLKKVHHLSELHTYDLNLNLISFEKEYSIEETQKLILNAISVLGTEYKAKFKKIYDEKYIDYASYKGKCSGGYSISTSTKNSRILLSFNGDLSSVSTIAHEGGHNVHHQFVKENNPIQYREVTSLVSEVASLTNECLLSSYIAKNGKTKGEKLAGIANIIDVMNSNLFGAVREGKIEQDFYEKVDKGGTITNDYMEKLTIDSFKKYYGDIVKLDEYSGTSWIRRSHYYMFFYLYAYSICIVIASYIASEILKGNQNVLEKYIEFLKTGADKWPLEAFSILGVDLTNDDVYIGAIKYYNSLLDEFEKLMEE